jgi:hypothetical protein
MQCRGCVASMGSCECYTNSNSTSTACSSSSRSMKVYAHNTEAHIHACTPSIDVITAIHSILQYPHEVKLVKEPNTSPISPKGSRHIKQSYACCPVIRFISTHALHHPHQHPLAIITRPPNSYNATLQHRKNAHRNCEVL